LLRHQPCPGGSISADLPLIADFVPLFVDFIPLFPSIAEFAPDDRDIKRLEVGALSESGPISGVSV
jgi:hypothetical protein